MKLPVRLGSAGRSEHALFFNTNRLEFKPRRVLPRDCDHVLRLAISEKTASQKKAERGSPFQLMGFIAPRLMVVIRVLLRHARLGRGRINPHFIMT